MPVFLSLLISMKSQSISELVSVDVTELSALFVLILGVFFFPRAHGTSAFSRSLYNTHLKMDHANSAQCPFQ